MYEWNAVNFHTSKTSINLEIRLKLFSYNITNVKISRIEEDECLSTALIELMELVDI